MPVVNCPHCDHEQIVRRELDGLATRCEKCREEFRVGTNGRRRPTRSDSPLGFVGVDITRILGLLVMAFGCLVMFWYLVVYDPTVDGWDGRTYNVGRMNRQLTGSLSGGLIFVGGSVLLSRRSD